MAGNLNLNPKDFVIRIQSNRAVENKAARVPEIPDKNSSKAILPDF